MNHNPFIHGTDMEATETTTTRGKLAETGNEQIIVTIPNSDYRLHLVPNGEITPSPTGHVVGVIEAKARRIDIVETGGRFVDPTYGRPRNLQGRVASVNTESNVIAVTCGPGVVFNITPTAPGQSAKQFAEGVLVRFAIDRGATFTQAT